MEYRTENGYPKHFAIFPSFLLCNISRSTVVRRSLSKKLTGAAYCERVSDHKGHVGNYNKARESDGNFRNHRY